MVLTDKQKERLALVLIGNPGYNFPDALARKYWVRRVEAVLAELRKMEEVHNGSHD